MQKIILWVALILSGFSVHPVEAETLPPGQPFVQTYVTQIEDTLRHLADKFYRKPQAWPAIWLATQHIAAKDPHFTPLDNPYFLKPGQRLLIPPEAEVERLLAEYQATGNTLGAEIAPVPLGAAWLADFRNYVEDARQHFGIPGVALALVRHNQIILVQGFGVREQGGQQPVTPETIFAIGSTTKAMNSMLIAHLVDEGVVAWDQPMVELWPDFRLSDPVVTPQIRLRDSLSMSSGLPRADLAWSGVALTPEQVMQSLADLPVVASRGQTFYYNNQMVATGGYAAALAAGGQYGHLGEAYTNLLQSRILAPIGMKSATLSVEVAQAAPNHATPHDFNLDGEVLPTYYHADPHIAPAGGVSANVLDLARFVMTQLNRGVAPDGTQVVSTENLMETWRPQIEIFPDSSYGMGWFIESYGGVEMIWHDGDVLGFKSLLAFIPEADVGLVLLTNRTISYGFSNSVRYRLIEAVYGLDVEAGQQYKAQWDSFMETIPQLRASLEATLPPAEVTPYLGQYSEGWQVEQHEDGTLWAVRGQYRWQLLAQGEGKFVVSNGFGITTPLEFIQDDQGNMSLVFVMSTGERGEYQQLKQ
jgi:CubicO group peptidase (beta-lactamase class C family)